jgi:hypothetical protein
MQVQLPAWSWMGTQVCLPGMLDWRCRSLWDDMGHVLTVQLQRQAALLELVQCVHPLGPWRWRPGLGQVEASGPVVTVVEPSSRSAAR